MSVDVIYDDAANENLDKLREEVEIKEISLSKLSIKTE